MTEILLDGSYQVNRSIYGGATLRTSTGIFSGGVYIFLEMLYKLKLLGNLTVCFDTGKSEYRKQIFPRYKADRPERPEDIEYALTTTFSYLDRILPLMGVPVVRMQGWEGDDVLYRLSQFFCNQQQNVSIVTDDSDFFQFVNHGAIIYRSMKQEYITKEAFVEKFDFDPLFYTLYLAIKGTHNAVPGIRGFGGKTTIKVIKQLKIPENKPIFASLPVWYSEGEEDKLKKKIRENFPMIKRNMMLVDLNYIPLTQEQVYFEYQRAKQQAVINTEEVSKIFQELEFRDAGKYMTFMCS